MEEYKNFLNGLAQMGDALVAINTDGSNAPIKLIVGRITASMVVNGDDIAMLRFAVENDDMSLEKLTAKIAGNTDAADSPVPEGT